MGSVHVPPRGGGRPPPRVGFLLIGEGSGSNILAVGSNRTIDRFFEVQIPTEESLQKSIEDAEHVVQHHGLVRPPAPAPMPMTGRSSGEARGIFSRTIGEASRSSSICISDQRLLPPLLFCADGVGPELVDGLQMTYDRERLRSGYDLDENLHAIESRIPVLNRELP